MQARARQQQRVAEVALHERALVGLALLRALPREVAPRREQQDAVPLRRKENMGSVSAIAAIAQKLVDLFSRSDGWKRAWLPPFGL